ncbi:MAG: flagellar basal body rod protein FlgB [Gammaproteobacteria bacterium]|nr:flagellar basal body rod protein FlgB [Gammaproteobacteria bacterium]
MPISFDSALGIHQKALSIRTVRTELIASNIANADTPGYKARDIDFKAALMTIVNQSKSSSSASLSTTHSKHIQNNAMNNNAEILYRVPNQSSFDGNTVDEQLEKSAFSENAIRYQASLTFLEGKFRGMLAAIKGE